MTVRRPADRLHGRAHGSDERRLPHLVVPAEQISKHLPGPLPVLTATQAQAQGLLTKAEVQAVAGLSEGQVRSRIALGQLQAVALLSREHASMGRPHLFARGDAETLT